MMLTYKPPSRNMALTPIFSATVIWRCHIKGRGSATTKTSRTRKRMSCIIHITCTLMHLPSLMVLFQANATGEHCQIVGGT